MKRLLSSYLAFTILFTGCASPFYTSAPSSTSEETGSLEIEFSKPGHATVLIDDQKVETPSKWVSSVVLNDVEAGEKDVDVTIVRRGQSSLVEASDTITIHPDQQSTMIVRNSGSNAGYWILLTTTSLAAILIANSISGS